MSFNSNRREFLHTGAIKQETDVLISFTRTLILDDDMEPLNRKRNTALRVASGPGREKNSLKTTTS